MAKFLLISAAATFYLLGCRSINAEDWLAYSDVSNSPQKIEPVDTASEQAPALPGGEASSSSEPDPIPDTLFSIIDRQYDKLQVLKRVKYHIPIEVGGWQWGHLDDDGKESGYGIPGSRGTTFFFINADPQIRLGEGFFKNFGAHAEFRFRENDVYRDFYSTKTWFYELYTKLDTDVGTFKAGKIWKRFGMDWDGSFLGTTAFFDGIMFDPDWGFSWEKTHKINNRLSIDTFAQFFVHEDGVNGSLPGADPESVVGSNERNTGVLRVVPRLKLTPRTTLEFGLSGLEGQIENRRGRDATHQAGAVDLSFSYCFHKHGELRLFGEAIQSFGVINPRRYVSGGPSSKIRNTVAGASVRFGPIIYRATYSEGIDENPNGRQHIWVGGATIMISKNVTLFVDRAKWFVKPQALPKAIKVNNGWELTLNWHF